MPIPVICLALMKLPLAQAGQLLLVTGIAFVIITLLVSTVRFHRLIELGEEELTTVDACNDFFVIQVTRFLTKLNRSSSGFAILVVQLQTRQISLRPVQEQLLHSLDRIIRTDRDKACLFKEDCVAAILDVSEDQAETVARRLMAALKKNAANLPDVSALRAGVSIFPLNGKHSMELIDAATDALAKADYQEALPLSIASPPEEETPADTSDGTNVSNDTSELIRKDRNAALDPLTGVLKPDSIGSYMRKYLFEIRRDKGPAAVLCVGINRIDDIISLHGEDAADAAIAGVSKVIQRLTRDSDLIGRYHRDDFLIMLPCSLEQGEQVSIRLREAVQKEVFLFEGKRIRCSISAGISAHPEHGKVLTDLFKGAYAALETVRKWNTSSCLVYDPAKHDKNKTHEKHSESGR